VLVHVHFLHPRHGYEGVHVRVAGFLSLLHGHMYIMMYIVHLAAQK
jgi:hypothetical protein